MPEPKSPYKRVRRSFNRTALKRVCEMHETEFPGAYDLTATLAPKRKGQPSWHDDPDYPDFFAFKDNGSNILAVAHLDTVMEHERRTARFLETAAGPVVYSGALDDRLGAYTILELLPRLGINVDILLTTGEESGNSTAQWFEAPEGKEYNWMIEFDRGGTDVVMYQYEDSECVQLVRDSGARVGQGSFSDVAFLGDLEVKGFNWGVGYQDYHGPRSHAYLEDYWTMIGHFLKFHETNVEEYLPHEERRFTGYGRSYGAGSVSTIYADDEHEWHDIDDPNPDCDECTIAAYERWERELRAEGHAADVGSDGSEDQDVEVDGEVSGEVDDELVSEDFDLVNRQLLAGG